MEYAGNYLSAGASDGPNLGFSSLQFNTWRIKTTEFLPSDDTDWGLHDRNVVWSNELGQPLLSDAVHVASSDFAISSMTVPQFVNQDGTSTITVNTSSASGFSVGDRIAISGVVPQLYDGVWTINAVNSSTQFTFLLPANYRGNGSFNYIPVPYVDETIHAQTDHSTTLVSDVVKVLSETLASMRYDSSGNLIQAAAPSATPDTMIPTMILPTKR
jgi:hypothetical protein